MGTGLARTVVAELTQHLIYYTCTYAYTSTYSYGPPLKDTLKK